MKKAGLVKKYHSSADQSACDFSYVEIIHKKSKGHYLVKKVETFNTLEEISLGKVFNYCNQNLNPYFHFIEAPDVLRKTHDLKPYLKEKIADIRKINKPISVKYHKRSTFDNISSYAILSFIEEDLILDLVTIKYIRKINIFTSEPHAIASMSNLPFNRKIVLNTYISENRLIMCFSKRSNVLYYRLINLKDDKFTDTDNDFGSIYGRIIRTINYFLDSYDLKIDVLLMNGERNPEVEEVLEKNIGLKRSTVEWSQYFKGIDEDNFRKSYLALGTAIGRNQNIDLFPLGIRKERNLIKFLLRLSIFITSLTLLLIISLIIGMSNVLIVGFKSEVFEHELNKKSEIVDDIFQNTKVEEIYSYFSLINDKKRLGVFNMNSYLEDIYLFTDVKEITVGFDGNDFISNIKGTKKYKSLSELYSAFDRLEYLKESLESKSFKIVDSSVVNTQTFTLSLRLKIIRGI